MYQVYNITKEEAYIGFLHMENAYELAKYCSIDRNDYAIIDDTSGVWIQAYHMGAPYRYIVKIPYAKKPLFYTETLAIASNKATSLRFSLGSWPWVIDSYTGEIVEKGA